MGDPRWAPGTGEFRVEEEYPGPGTVVLSVRGEADLHVAPELRDRLDAEIDRGVNRLVLDLSATTFVDSTILGVLVGASRRMRSRREGELRLVIPQVELRRVFEVTLLDRVLRLDATRDDALRSSPVAD